MGGGTAGQTMTDFRDDARKGDASDLAVGARVAVMVLAAIAKLRFPGCVGRQVKWSGVFTQEERAALNKPKDRTGRFVAEKE